MPKRTVFVSGTPALPSHTPFALLAFTRFCAYRVTALTRLIFTAYHRLNIDLRMWYRVRSERPPVLYFSLSLCLPPPPSLFSRSFSLSVALPLYLFLSLLRSPALASLAPRFRVRLIFWHREFDDTASQR